MTCTYDISQLARTSSLDFFAPRYYSLTTSRCYSERTSSRTPGTVVQQPLWLSYACSGRGRCSERIHTSATVPCIQVPSRGQPLTDLVFVFHRSRSACADVHYQIKSVVAPIHHTSVLYYVLCKCICAFPCRNTMAS